MNGPEKSLFRVSLPWLLLIACAALFLAFRLQLSFDLSLFFPHSTNLAQKILLKQMESGPGSRFIIIGIRGSSRDRLARASDRLKAVLTDNPAFLQVQNGLPPDDLNSIPQVISDYRFVLTDLDYGEASLRHAAENRIQDLSFGGGSQLVNLISEDPFLSVLDILERLAPVENLGNHWFSADGQAVLLAETRNIAMDIAAQTHAVNVIKTAFDSINSTTSLTLELTGVGAFGVELQRTIREEATWRSFVAALCLLLVLFVAYRSIRLVLIAGIPLALGFLVGLSLVTLVFHQVHGIILAFGFTLLGIAIDYPLHLFSHARAEPATSAVKRIWPTMRVGALSTLMAYVAILLAGSNGLAQLGLFTAGGLVAAIAATRFWLPHLLRPSEANVAINRVAPTQPHLAMYPAAIAMFASFLVTYQLFSQGLWEDSLSSLSPLPQERLLQDNQLRTALGAPDMRYQLVLYDKNLNSLLLKNEQLEDQLEEAVEDGILKGWKSVSALLPSTDLQQIRKERIPQEEELRARLSAAIATLPFNENAFDPFLAEIRKARDLGPLAPDNFKNTPLATLLAAHLFQIDGIWISLTFLVSPDSEALNERIQTWEPRPELTDIRESSDGLLREFRSRAIRSISVAALLMVGLLFLDRHRPRRILWLALTVSAALGATIAVVTMLHAKLTIIHLIALLLVFGLGLDYALFFSRAESNAEYKSTRHALIACMASTVLAFGILGGSSIPLLRNLGVTVAIGTAISFLLAWVGSSKVAGKTN